MEILSLKFSEKINLNDRPSSKDPKPRRYTILEPCSYRKRSLLLHPKRLLIMRKNDRPFKIRHKRASANPASQLQMDQRLRIQMPVHRHPQIR